jgi:hypoxanthine-guanine phosphoribosyltransferase
MKHFWRQTACLIKKFSSHYNFSYNPRVRSGHPGQTKTVAKKIFLVPRVIASGKNYSRQKISLILTEIRATDLRYGSLHRQFKENRLKSNNFYIVFEINNYYLINIFIFD